MAGRAIDMSSAVIASRAGIQVRPAQLDDLWMLRVLQRRCFSGSQAYGLVTLLMLFLWPKARILVAWSGERMAGCVVGDARDGQTRILNLCVDPDFRRRGIGSLLLSTAETMFGMDQVTLMVEDKNLGAQELYRTQGYLPVGDLRNYYGRNRHGILMQKRRSSKQ